MAGGKPPPNMPSQKPSSSHRKSRWEPAIKPSSDKKEAAASNSKPPAPKNKTKSSDSPANKKGNDETNPTPKPKPSPSPSHPRPSSDRALPPGPLPFTDFLNRPPPPPPAYGFHMLERRTIVLADGSARCYFALPPDYQDYKPPSRPMLPHGPEFHGSGLGFDRQFSLGGPLSPEFRNLDEAYMRGRKQDQWNSLGPDGHRGLPSENLLKRKFGDEVERGRIDGREENTRSDVQRQQVLLYGNPNGFSAERGELMAGTSSPYMGRGDDIKAQKIMRTSGEFTSFHSKVGHKHNEVDQLALKKAFLNFAKVVNENIGQKKVYLADGKQGPVRCLACGRPSRDFPDTHGLIMHSYYYDSSSDKHVDHLGLHKAVCALMGWNYLIPPDNSKSYQTLSTNEAAANQEDLIMWPPMVIIHNTTTGKAKDGRTEGLGNKVMDNKLRDLGFGGGKAKSLYGREGHLGVTLVKFAGDQSGLKEAVRLADFFEKENHGRRSWARVHSLLPSKDSQNDPELVKLDERTGEKQRILYGYLGTASDLDKLDLDTRKKVPIESRRERLQHA